MRTAKDILHDITSKKDFKRVNEYQGLRSVKKLFTPPLIDNIQFVYKSEDTLFFVLNHPAIKMEFNYKLKSIKKQLKEFIKINLGYEIVNIKSFVTNRVYKKRLKYEFETDVIVYEERSDGRFKNLAKDEEIRAIFEEIRQIIKNNKEAL